jgi:hypothetical protein
LVKLNAIRRTGGYLALGGTTTVRIDEAVDQRRG